MRLEAFENGLAIVERSQCGRKRDRAERNNLGLLPGARFPIGDEHVVAECGAEFGIFAQRFGETGLGYAGDGDRCGHRASKVKKEEDRQECLSHKTGIAGTTATSRPSL